MANDNPCYGCTKRKPGCQDTCPDGIAWKEKYKAKCAKIKAERQKDTAATSAIIELTEKVKRNRTK